MYYIITSRGQQFQFTNEDSAVQCYRTTEAFEKRLYYRDNQGLHLKAINYGKPDPKVKTGKNGLRFMIMAR